MLFAAMLIDALHPALEHGEIVLDRVGVNGWIALADVLLGAVHRLAVAYEMTL